VSTGRPPWRQALDRAGRPLEDITTSPAYANLLAVGIMARRAAVGAVARVVSGLFGPVRRVANVPSRDDVRQLSGQVTALASEVRALAESQQESRRRAAVSEPPKSRRPRG
jgi:hypothetical protein